LNIVVFGGSKGIGRVFVDRMLTAGHKVTVLSRSWKPNDLKVMPNFFPVDFCNAKHLSNTLEELVSSGSSFDSLVFCQRYRGDGDAWDGEISSSLLAFKLAVEILTPYMPKNSSIVAISSSAAKLIAAEQPVGYHMAKAGLEHMIRYYAVQLGAKGIKVNGVAPPVTIKPENEEFYRLNPILVETICSSIPLARMCKAEDVCEVIEFLMTSSYVTGQIITVDGGLGLVTQESTAKKIANIKDEDLVHPEGKK
jgi:NAD(P)-dependent dehydrogenase (short-subunit alcohol dehydrogenase family)